MSMTPGKKANYIFYLLIITIISSLLTIILIREINKIESFVDNNIFYYHE